MRNKFDQNQFYLQILDSLPQRDSSKIIQKSGKITLGLDIEAVHCHVRMAEWSKALRSGRSPLLWAWVRIPLLTY